MESNNINTKEKVFDLICKAIQMDTLGLFIGSGFTKALLLGNPQYNAFDWKELLKQSAKQMNIHRDIINEGLPFPQIATIICDEYVRQANVTYKEARRKLKYIIAGLVDVYPTANMIKKYDEHFNTLMPNWIVTTNYDSIIEQILREKAFTINPNNSYIKIKNFIPIYHIHGSKSDPESIVITNEDYTHTLRISDYRHARLPFLMKESTVLMIGYSLNDLNVLSAVDYCQNVYSNLSVGCDNQIIQLLFTKYPNEEPYIDQNGIIIQEINDISEFLSELTEYNIKYRGVIGKKTKKINELVDKFSNAKEDYINEFIDDKVNRLTIIKTVCASDYEFRYVYSPYINFLNNVLGKLWDKASGINQFSFYNDIISILLDLIENTDYSKSPDNYLEFLVSEFNDIARHLGKSRGDAWDAYDTWNKRKINMPKEFSDEIIKRSNNNQNSYARNIIEKANGNVENKEQ